MLCPGAAPILGQAPRQQQSSPDMTQMNQRFRHMDIAINPAKDMRGNAPQMLNRTRIRMDKMRRMTEQMPDPQNMMMMQSQT